MLRLRLGQTYRSYILCLVERKNNNKCEECGVKDGCIVKYAPKKERFRKIVKTGHELSLKGILGTEENQE